MDGEDRNTLITIAVVLIVSVVSLITVIAFSWSFISGPLENLGRVVVGVYQNRVFDYNFAISLNTAQAEEAMDVNDSERDLEVTFSNVRRDYNFRIPRIAFDINQIGIESAIIQDAVIAGYASTNSNLPATQTQLQLEVPRAGIDSPVWSGTDANGYLEKGFWVYPFSGNLGEGETVLLCHRRYFGPNDPRSCWFLDNVEENDLLYLTVGNELTLEYKVSEIYIYDDQDPNIYNIDENRDALRIVTCHPLYSNEQRFVVIADRVGN